MILAIEDALSEAVARKMVTATRSDLAVTTVIGLRGSGYLRAKARELNRTAQSLPVMLLTDLDSPQTCPPSLITLWLGTTPQSQLLFRVAVMEVESWVLADRERIADLLLVPQHRVPEDTDSISDPKQFLVNLARKSRSKDIREDIVPVEGSMAKVGPAYNPRLTTFVEQTWRPRRAARSSRSLAKALLRLRTAFKPN